MAENPNQEHRNCGLYITGLALEGHEDHLGENVMVYFHNHSTAGPPIVLLPDTNTHNRWKFQEQGHLIEDQAYIGAMKPLPAEGFYQLKQHLHLDKEKVLPEHTIIQLGYTRTGGPILFLPTLNDLNLTFPATGFRWDDAKVIFESISDEPLHVMNLPALEAETLH